MNDTEIADKMRAAWATPGMDDPAWVNAELARIGQTPIVDGQQFRTDSDDVVEVVVALNLDRWAVLGGASPGDLMTAEILNRGRLVSAILQDESERSSAA